MNIRSISIIVMGMILISLSSQAQVVSKDSINTLKQEKDILVLQKELNTQKLQLAKLENSIDDKRHDMESAQADAQKSADENARIATQLSSEPDNRKLARKARKLSKQLQRDGRNSRNASDNFAELQKDIDVLKKKIADNEEKISSMQANSKG